MKIASPNETTIDHNGGIDLVCYTDTKSLNFAWSRTNSKGLTTTIAGAKQTHRLVGVQSVLELRNANQNDEGIYTCSLDVGGVIHTASVKVNVQGMYKLQPVMYAIITVEYIFRSVCLLII